MNEHPQIIIDEVSAKIVSNFKKVSWKEIQSLVLALNTRIKENDELTNTISKRDLMLNFDYLTRASYELTGSRRPLHSLSKHYVCSNLLKACNGFFSIDRREQLINNKISFNGYVRYNNNCCKADYLIFCKDTEVIILIEHRDGFKSILDRAEDILMNIANESLLDAGFDYNYKNMRILVKDVCNVYFEFSFSSMDFKYSEIVKSVYDDSFEYYKRHYDSEIDSLTKDVKYDINGLTIFNSSQEYDGYKYLQKLFNRTEKSLLLIEPYLDNTFINLIRCVNDKVEIKVVTKRYSKFEEELKRVVLQRKNIIIKKNNIIHDRYLMIDENVFLIGTSLNGVGKKNSIIVPIKSEIEIDLVKSNLNELWRNSDEILAE